MKHLLQYQNIKVLAVIPEGLTGRFEHRHRHADHWKQPRMGSAPIKHDTLAVAVFNAAGGQWLTPPHITAFNEVWGRQHRHIPVLSPPPDNQPYVPKVPRALRTLNESPKAQTHPCMAHMATSEEVNFPCTKYLSAPKNGVYTDGSCIKIQGQQFVGAAIYVTKNRISIKINPNGKTYTNTITRAELSAILTALTHPDVGSLNEALHIYTDSLCSIHMIRRILNSPWTLKESKHYDLLSNIVHALWTRAEQGGHTHIYKVKSHSGIKSNDIVDAKAKEAALKPQEADVVDTSDYEPYSRRPWVCLSPEAASDPTLPPREPYYLPSLRDGIKRALDPKLSGGLATTGFYTQAWSDALGATHLPSNARMWKDPSIKWKQVMLTMKARWGQLWNQRLAHRYKLADSPNCPLCGCMDSVGHLLGGCDHPTARANKISRHDDAVKLVQKAIAMGPKGGWYMVMDAGKDRDLPVDVMGKRIPAWLFPAPKPVGDSWTRTQYDEDANLRKKLRPDILIIEGLAEGAIRGLSIAEIRSYLQANPRFKIHVIEVGYCGDLNHAAKDFDKRLQHEQLVALLRSAGLNVTFHDPVTLGRCGTIPSSFIALMKDAFGLSSPQAEAVAFKLNRHAVQWVDKMYTHRQCVTRNPG